MMGRDTKFSDSWLSKQDPNRDLISDWCEKVANDPFSARCIACLKTFSVASMGFLQIESHAKGSKHQMAIKQRKGQTFFRKMPNLDSDLVQDSAASSTTASATVTNTASASRTISSTTSSTASSSTSTASALQLVVPEATHWIPVGLNDKVTKAETLFALKLAASNYSFSSYDTMPEICKLAFADSEIAQHMTLSATKLAYTIVHGLAPHLKTEFLKDIRKATVPYFTVYFDETPQSK